MRLSRMPEKEGRCAQRQEPHPALTEFLFTPESMMHMVLTEPENVAEDSLTADQMQARAEYRLVSKDLILTVARDLILTLVERTGPFRRFRRVVSRSL